MTTVPFTEVDLRTALGHFASGVVVVTGQHAGAPRGLACQSFFSLSLDPPLIAIALARTSTSWADIERSGAFGVNMLHADQVDLCRAFGRSGGDKFAGLDWSPGATTGAPRLADSLAWIECGIEDVHPAGDHLLAVGRVLDFEVNAGRPLLFYRGRFGVLHDHHLTGVETNLEHLITGLRLGWG
jgi:flavin reductase (DIM6/NTAB) family NADH-FMN oxidoreductase RutF